MGGSYRSKPNAHDTETREIKRCSVREEQSWNRKWDLVSLIRLLGPKKQKKKKKKKKRKDKRAQNQSSNLPVRGVKAKGETR